MRQFSLRQCHQWQEFNWFIGQNYNITSNQADNTGCRSNCMLLLITATIYISFTLLLSPIAENYFITPWGAEGRVVFGIPQGMCCAACVKAAAARHSEQAHKHTYSAAVTTLSDSAELMLITVVLVVVLLLRPL